MKNVVAVIEVVKHVVVAGDEVCKLNLVLEHKQG